MVMIKITVKITKIIKLFFITLLVTEGFSQQKKLLNKKVVSYLKRNSKTNYLLKTIRHLLSSFIYLFMH